MLTLAESTMIPVISGNHQSLIKETFGKSWDESGVIDEVNSGFGIADVVFFDRKNFSALDAERNVFFDSEDQIRTLLVVNEQKTFSITDLSQRLSLSPNKIKNHIRFFEEAGFVSEINKGSYQVIRQYEIGLQNNIAIEAKVRDWRRGLYQAYRYRWFSNASYLAVHHEFSAAPKRNLNEFIHLNVGLIEVTNDEAIVIHKPQIEVPRSQVITALAYEQILERYGQNTDCQTYRNLSSE
jgi:hypothetical protein